jgi:hypothetical protein
MRRIAQKMLVAAGALALIAVPVPADAVGYEDSFQDCQYPEMFDLMVMRPAGLIGTVLGATGFVLLAPVSVITVPDELPRIYDSLLGDVGRFTFSRPLGECLADGHAKASS